NRVSPNKPFMITLHSTGSGFFERDDCAQLLDHEVLPHYMPGCRWFGGKAKEPCAFSVAELIPVVTAGRECRFALGRVEYANVPAETYSLPLMIYAEGAPAAVGPIATFADGAALIDALHDDGFRRVLPGVIEHGTDIPGFRGKVTACHGAGLPPGASDLPSRL